MLENKILLKKFIESAKYYAKQNEEGVENLDSKHFKDSSLVYKLWILIVSKINHILKCNKDTKK